MKLPAYRKPFLLFAILLLLATSATAQIGRRFPSEMKTVTDPVTGVQLTFLTSTSSGDFRLYHTHRQWTADGKWVIFRSNRAPGETLAVNEETGDIVQVTEGSYLGVVDVAGSSMNLYFMRMTLRQPGQTRAGPIQIVEVDLEKLLADSESGNLKDEREYQKVCGTIPAEMEAGGDMALDACGEWIYFRVGKTEASRHIAPGTTIEPDFGPLNMGAGPTGISSINIKTREIRFVIALPFQVGHIQTNPWVPGEIVFCWETGGKAPQRTWTVKSDGTGLRPLYPESEYEWVTHEAVITKDEVAFAIMGHRPAGALRAVADRTGIKPENAADSVPGKDWGPSGTREKPTGLGIINLRTGEMMIAGQTHSGSGLWHVHGSSDGRWAAGDDFDRNIYLIDRQTHEMKLLSAGHKTTAADHPHPAFSSDGTRIVIQSAMLSENGRSMNICIIPVR